MLNEKTSCKECEYVKCYAVSRQMYYCDHENRIDDMGKLGADFLPEESPIWCPKRDKRNDLGDE